MISIQEVREAQSDARLTLKTQDQTLIRQAMEGAGLTRWEAEVLPKVVDEIYFQRGLNRPWKDGQIRYQCVGITVSAGRKLTECGLVPVALSVIDVESDRAVLREQTAVALRRSKVMRVSSDSSSFRPIATCSPPKWARFKRGPSSPSPGRAGSG